MLNLIQKINLFKNTTLSFSSYKRPTPIKVKIFFHCVALACIASATTLYTLIQSCQVCCIGLGLFGFVAMFIQEYISEREKDDRKS